MNVFTSGFRHQPWVWQVTALCFVLGFLLAGSLQTVSYVHRAGAGPSRVGVPPASGASISTVRAMEEEVKNLRERNRVLTDALGQGGNKVQVLSDELLKINVLAGLTPIHGPGIILTFTDSKKHPPSNRAFEADKYIIHDVDLQQVINELGASGAESCSINNQRITGRTAIRCVGPTIQVNSIPIAPPFEIRAIGDPATLWGGLNLPLGVLDGIRRYDPEMFRLDKKPDITIPAFSGSTEFRFAKPVEEKAIAGKDKAE